MKAQMLLIAAAVYVTLAACTTSAPQRMGQSTTVDFGVVKRAEPVTLDSNAARGAVIGGTLGLARARATGARSRAANTLVGAGMGGALASAAQGSREGMSYTVAKLNGSTMRIVTDQREIREGDCVVIERAGQTANIRRTSDAYCDTAYQAAISDVMDEVRAQAARCARAKQELTDAATDDEANLAVRKIELLCNS